MKNYLKRNKVRSAAIPLAVFAFVSFSQGVTVHGSSVVAEATNGKELLVAVVDSWYRPWTSRFYRQILDKYRRQYG